MEGLLRKKKISQKDFTKDLFRSNSSTKRSCWQGSYNITFLKTRKQPPEVFCKKVVFKSLTNFTGKHLCQSLFFNKAAASHAEVRLQWSCKPTLFCKPTLLQISFTKITLRHGEGEYLFSQNTSSGCFRKHHENTGNHFFNKRRNSIIGVFQRMWFFKKVGVFNITSRQLLLYLNLAKMIG